jgi:creatinine amidohydrolase
MIPSTNELERMTWSEVDRYLQTDQRLAFVLGATEQHGHLALGNDTLNPLEIARRATSAEGVLLAPPLHYGFSNLMSAFPGTLGLTADTYAHVVRDLVASAYRSGFRRLFFFNGNGPHNFLIPAHLHEMMDSLPDLVCDWFDWSSEPDVIRRLEAIRARGETHANWGENWPVSRPAHYELPDEEPWWEYTRHVLLHTPAEVRANVPSGSFGGPQAVPADDMSLVIDYITELSRERLRRLGGPA